MAWEVINITVLSDASAWGEKFIGNEIF